MEFSRLFQGYSTGKPSKCQLKRPFSFFGVANRAPAAIMVNMKQNDIDKGVEKVKGFAADVADKIPLPLHYFFDGIFMLVFLVDIMPFIGADPLPLVNEIIEGVLLYYYNAYLLRRTYGVINPVRIVRGESPMSKKRMGLLPYEQQMAKIKQRLKALKKTAKKENIPGLTPDKVKNLSGQVKVIEDRLRLLDRMLAKPEFQEGTIRTEIARIEVQIEGFSDLEMKKEYETALGHARDHLANVERLREERNRLVARLNRFSLQLSNTYSRLLTTAESPMQESETSRVFDELSSSISAFDESLKEITAKQPSSDMYRAAVKEIEETEAKVKTGLTHKETTKTI